MTYLASMKTRVQINGRESELLALSARVGNFPGEVRPSTWTFHGSAGQALEAVEAAVWLLDGRGDCQGEILATFRNVRDRLRTFVEGEPTTAVEVFNIEPLALAKLADHRAERIRLDRERWVLIHEARQAGIPWRPIAEALGMSAAGALKLYTHDAREALRPNTKAGK
jgi:hypothetical protein